MPPASISPCAPTFAKYGYPQLAQACVTDQAPALVKNYPNFFMFQQSTTTYAKGAIGVLKKLKDGGQIGDKVAVVNVGDDFGIELANAGRPLFKEAGFEIVYDKSYPLGTQDYAPVIKAAKAANPDAFVAWSYPPDTFGLAEQAKIEDLNVKAYFSAVATPSRAFRKSSARRPRMFSVPAASSIRRKSMTTTSGTRKLPASTPTTGATRSTTHAPGAHAIHRSVGSMDRKAIAAYLKNKFKTFLGELSCRVRSSTRSIPSGSGRAASSTLSPAKASPTFRRSS